MKKILSILGLILMLFNGIAVISLLGTLPSVFREEQAGGILLSYLLMIVIFGGLFYLGYRLNASNGGAAAADHKTEKPAAAKMPKQQKTTKPVKREKTGRRGDDDNKPKVGRDEVLMYWDPNAEKATRYSGRSTLYEVRACMQEGKPIVRGISYVYIEIGVGKFWTETETDNAEIPADMLGRLSFDVLREWLSSYRRKWNIDWDDMSLRQKMSIWCWQVSELASSKVPDCVYPVLNPFEWLEDVGPDGLRDESGIGLWLRMKENVTASEAIRALAMTQRKWKIAILTEDENLLKKDSDLNAEALSLCERSGIIFCYRTGSDTFRDLVDMGMYRVKTEEWPGAADDAATYGRWWLEKLSTPSKG